MILAFCPAAVLAAASALGTVLRPLLPEELPVFLSASLLMLLGFPVLQPARTLPPYLEKAVQNSSLPPAPFFWPWGFPLTTEQQAWEPDWPGPLWLSFSSFP